MAVGDDAVAEGFPIVPDSGSDEAKVKWGAREINRTRDLVAQVKRLVKSPPIGGRPVGDVNSSNKIGLYWNGTRPVFKVDSTTLELAKQSDIAGKADASALNGKANANGATDQVRYSIGTKEAHNREAGSNRYSVWVDGGLQFGRATSSRRYKEDIQNWVINPANVLALVPKFFHRKVDPTGVYDYGLIAEEVHETLPEIIQWWKDPEKPNSQPVIDGIHYELLSVALLSVVQDQERRIQELERRLNEPQN